MKNKKRAILNARIDDYKQTIAVLREQNAELQARITRALKMIDTYAVALKDRDYIVAFSCLALEQCEAEIDALKEKLTLVQTSSPQKENE